MSTSPATSSRWKDAVVESVAPLTARIASVKLHAPLSPHIAGQHLDVRLTAPDGYAAQRAYSIASAPGAALFELAIEKLDDGEVSPFFHEVVQPGDTIEVRGPLGGHFIWRPLDGGPLLLVAGGSGIAPLMAMLRDWAAAADADGAGVPLLLAYSARTWEELAFRDEIMAIAARHPTLDFVAVTTRGPRMRDGDLSQRLDGPSIRALLQGWGRTPRQTFICGANRFVDAVANGLLDAGVAAGTIKTERYGGA